MTFCLPTVYAGAAVILITRVRPQGHGYYYY